MNYTESWQVNHNSNSTAASHSLPTHVRSCRNSHYSHSDREASEFSSERTNENSFHLKQRHVGIQFNSTSFNRTCQQNKTILNEQFKEKLTPTTVSDNPSTVQDNQYAHSLPPSNIRLNGVMHVNMNEPSPSFRSTQYSRTPDKSSHNEWVRTPIVKRRSSNCLRTYDSAMNQTAEERNRHLGLNSRRMPSESTRENASLSQVSYLKWLEQKVAKEGNHKSNTLQQKITPVTSRLSSSDRDKIYSPKEVNHSRTTTSPHSVPNHSKQLTNPLKKINIEQYRARRTNDSDQEKFCAETHKPSQEMAGEKSNATTSSNEIIIIGDDTVSPATNSSISNHVKTTTTTVKLMHNRLLLTEIKDKDVILSEVEDASKSPLKGIKNIKGTRKFIQRKETVIVEKDSAAKTNPQNQQTPTLLAEKKETEVLCKHCGIMTPSSSTHCLSCKHLLTNRKSEETKMESRNSFLLKEVKRKIGELELGETKKRSEEENETDSAVTAPKTIPLLKETFYGKRGNIEEPGAEGSRCEREKSVDEPVILTISSDDEDDRNSKEPTLIQPVELSFTSKEPDMKNDYDDSEFLTRNSILLGGGSQGEDSADAESEGDFVTLKCRSIWIGSYRVIPKERVKLTKGCFTMVIPTLIEDEDPATLILKNRGIVKVLAHLEDELPVFFLYVRPSLATYVRRLLRMSDRNGSYLDPISSDESIKRITIIAETIKPEFKSSIHQFYSCEKVLDTNGTEFNYFEYLSLEEVNNIILKSAPSVEIQSSASKSYSKQESKKLFIYPAPPNKGGITVTTDDYCCLEEEQFLNDVILDFYLRWLLLSETSDEDRERTHVFSTFFYKRLTSKPKKGRRPHSTEDDPNLTPAQKRHARVKSWTKNVDIFTKDFILIPINEHSHWFLAVICFPGLDGPVRISDGQPVTKVKEKVVRMPNKPKKRIEIPVIDDVEWSDRDEAEGDEEELDGDDDDEPPTKRAKTENENDKEVTTATMTTTTTTTEKSEEKKMEESTDAAIKQPCILIFDSLQGRSRSRIVATLRDYLSVEHLLRKGVVKVFSKDTMKGACPKVPQQMNFSDCGLYTLQFAQSFFERPLKNFRFPIRTLVDWFNQDVVACKREFIAKLIQSLMDKYKSSHDITLPPIHFNSVKGKPSSHTTHAPTVTKKPIDMDIESEEPNQNVAKWKSIPRIHSPTSGSLDSHVSESFDFPKEPKKIKINLRDKTYPTPHPKTPTLLTGVHSPPLTISDDDSGNQSEMDDQFTQKDSCGSSSPQYRKGIPFSCNSAFKLSSAKAEDGVVVPSTCKEIIGSKREAKPSLLSLKNLSTFKQENSKNLVSLKSVTSSKEHGSAFRTPNLNCSDRKIQR